MCIRDSFEHCKNFRMSTDILWRVFHILTVPVPYTFIWVNRRNNEARGPRYSVDPRFIIPSIYIRIDTNVYETGSVKIWKTPQNVSGYTYITKIDGYTDIFTVCRTTRRRRHDTKPTRQLADWTRSDALWTARRTCRIDKLHRASKNVLHLLGVTL